MITNLVAILAVLSIVVGVMIWLERFRRFKKLGAAAASILLALGLSSAGVLPNDGVSGTSGAVQS